MRVNNESMRPEDRDRIWDVYYARFVASPTRASTERLVAAVPPAEQVATYRWVFEKSGYVESKGFLRVRAGPAPGRGGPGRGGACDLPIGPIEDPRPRP